MQRLALTAPLLARGRCAMMVRHSLGRQTLWYNRKVGTCPARNQRHGCKWAAIVSTKRGLQEPQNYTATFQAVDQPIQGATQKDGAEVKVTSRSRLRPPTLSGVVTQPDAAPRGGCCGCICC